MFVINVWNEPPVVAHIFKAYHAKYLKALFDEMPLMKNLRISFKLKIYAWVYQLTEEAKVFPDAVHL